MKISCVPTASSAHCRLFRPWFTAILLASTAFGCEATRSVAQHAPAPVQTRVSPLPPPSLRSDQRGPILLVGRADSQLAASSFGYLAGTSFASLTIWSPQGDIVHTSAVPAHSRLSWSHDGQMLHISDFTRASQLWTARTGLSTVAASHRSAHKAIGIPPSRGAMWLGEDASEIVLLDSRLRKVDALPRSPELKKLAQQHAALAKLAPNDSRREWPGGISSFGLSRGGDVVAAVVETAIPRPQVFIQFWSLAQRQFIGSISAPEGILRIMHGPADQDFVVQADFSKTWLVSPDKLGTKAALSELPPMVSELSELGLSSDGTTWIAMGRDELLALSAVDFKRKWSAKADTHNGFSGLSVGSEWVAVADRNTGLRRFDIRNGRPLATTDTTLRLVEEVEQIDADRMMVRAHDYGVPPLAPIDVTPAAIVIWSRQTPERSHSVRLQTQPVGVTLEADGNLVVAESLPTLQPSYHLELMLSRYQLPERGGEAVLLSRSGPYLPSVMMHLQTDASNQRCLVRLHQDEGYETTAVAAIKSGTHVILDGTDGMATVRQPGFSPDGQLVAALTQSRPGDTERLTVWNAQTGALVRVSNQTGDYAYSPKYHFLAVGTFSKMCLRGEPCGYSKVTIAGPDAQPVSTTSVPWELDGLRFDPIEPWVAATSAGKLVVRSVDGSAINAEQLKKHWYPVIRKDKRGIDLVSGTGETMATWASSTSGGHIVYTPDGTYAGQGDGPNLAGWVLDGASSIRRLGEGTSQADPSLIRRRLGIANE